MKYTKKALTLLAAKESGQITTNAKFWNLFYKNKLDEILDNDKVRKTYENMDSIFRTIENNNKYEEGFICVYDEDFPFINSKVKNKSEKPYLLFYKGDFSLLKNLNNNVAVVGLTDIDEEIKKRESIVIKKLVEENMVIVSGLAQGCDTVAHKVCIEFSGKTIAILPTSLKKIYPAENKELANKILKKGGLLLSEYYKEASSKYEAIQRFVERDRLQAMFSKAIILIASYRKNEGNSGSRYAMEAAKKYDIERYVIYNPKKDKNNIKFSLNKDYFNNKEEKVKRLVEKSIKEIKNIENKNLIEKKDVVQQMVLI